MSPSPHRRVVSEAILEIGTTFKKVKNRSKIGATLLVKNRSKIGATTSEKSEQNRSNPLLSQLGAKT